MLQFVYYSRKESLISHFVSLEGQQVFITPNPQRADGLRSFLEGRGGDVVTIAKFMSDLAQEIWSQEDGPQTKRKAELLLTFGLLKHKYFAKLELQQFKEAYDLFSDLRSYTLDLTALSHVLEEYPTEIRSAVEIFWKILELTGFTDEHGAYYQMTQKLRSDFLPKNKMRMVFWGFQHLNGLQVDFLKALAIHYEVIVPLPLSLKEKLKKSDWPIWLRDEFSQEVELNDSPVSPEGKWIKVNSRELTKTLSALLSTDRYQQIILGVSKLGPLHLDIVPAQVDFKIPTQVLRAELKMLAERFQQELKSLTLNLSQFQQYVEEKLQTSRKKSPVDFKIIKVIQLYQRTIRNIQEITDEDILVDGFFLSVLREVVELSLPRTSYVPLSKSDAHLKLTDMSSLSEVSRKGKIILCVDDRFEDIQGPGQKYPMKVQVMLASLGPIKRNELELLFKEWEFRDLFSHGDMTVLMSESTLKHSLVWKKLFSSIHLNEMAFPHGHALKPLKDPFYNRKIAKFQGHLSASKFQTYIDCPRKFYYSYVDKIFPQVTLEKDLDALSRGTLTHKMIEEYFKRKLTIEKVPNLVHEIFMNHIQEQGLRLSHDIAFQRELVFNHRTCNGVMFLNQVEEILQEKIDWRLEQDFKCSDDFELRGKIDCIGVASRSFILLDFKSTKSSASSPKEIEGFESLQLWTYALGASRLYKDFVNKSVTIGFVVLDEPAESTLLTSDEDFHNQVKKTKFFKSKLFKSSFQDSFNESLQRMLELSKAIEGEERFPPRPRKIDTCKFCELTHICLKRET